MIIETVGYTRFVEYYFNTNTIEPALSEPVLQEIFLYLCDRDVIVDLKSLDFESLAREIGQA